LADSHRRFTVHSICLPDEYFKEPIMCTWTIEDVIAQRIVTQQALDDIVKRLVLPLQTAKNKALAEAEAVAVAVAAEAEAAAAAAKKKTTPKPATTGVVKGGKLTALLDALQAVQEERSEAPPTAEEAPPTVEQEEDPFMGAEEVDEEDDEDVEVEPPAAKPRPAPFYAPILPDQEAGWPILHEQPPPPVDRLLAPEIPSVEEEGEVVVMTTVRATTTKAVLGESI
jgi:hypothetical protein